MRGRACCVGIGMCRAVREHRPSTSGVTSGGGLISRGSRRDHMITPADKSSSLSAIEHPKNIVPVSAYRYLQV
jgi:hypothetical protein